MNDSNVRSDYLKRLKKDKLELLVLDSQGYLEEARQEAESLFLDVNFANPETVNTSLETYSSLERQLLGFLQVTDFYAEDPDHKMRSACKKVFSIETILDEKKDYFSSLIARKIDETEISFRKLSYSTENIPILTDLENKLEILENYSTSIDYHEGTRRIDGNLRTIRTALNKLRCGTLTNDDEERFDLAVEKAKLDEQFNEMYGSFMAGDWENPKRRKELIAIRSSASVIRDKYDSLDDDEGVEKASVVETKCDRLISRLYSKRRRTIGGKVATTFGIIFTAAFLIEAACKIDQSWPYIQEKVSEFYSSTTIPEPKQEERLVSVAQPAPTSEQKRQRTISGQELSYTSQKDVPNSLEMLSKRYPGIKYFVYVDKDDNKTRLYQTGSSTRDLQKVFEFESSDATVLGPKLKEGDAKTPEGVYGITKYWHGGNPFYGAAAICLDYPNSTDKKNRRTGSGIMICGTNDKRKEDSIRAGFDCSNGGVILLNKDMLALYRHIAPYVEKTIVIIEDSNRPLTNLLST